MTDTGLIIRGIGGFYTVRADGRLYECRARGVFRKRGITPLCGDRVRFEKDPSLITEVLPRKNALLRPPLANLDCLVIVSSAAEPLPNALTIDKMTAVAALKKIEPVIVFTKTDLADCSALAEGYRRAGFPVFLTRPGDGAGVSALLERLSGKFCAFTGNSGVGKSTLLNRIDGRLGLKTGEISQKLGRGRHTTRCVTLYEAGGALIADTPGFSTLDLERVEPVLKEDLPDCFREFSRFTSSCRFTGCSHMEEKGCAVREAVARGEIAASRYESYRTLYSQVRELKEWELRKKEDA